MCKASFVLICLPLLVSSYRIKRQKRDGKIEVLNLNHSSNTSDNTLRTALRTTFKHSEAVDEVVEAHENMMCFLKLKDAVDTQIRKGVSKGLEESGCTQTHKQELVNFKSGTLKAIQVTFEQNGACRVTERDKQYDLHVTLCYRASQGFHACNSMLSFISPDDGDNFIGPLEKKYKEALSVSGPVKWTGNVRALPNYMVMDVTDLEDATERIMTDGAHISLFKTVNNGGANQNVIQNVLRFITDGNDGLQRNSPIDRDAVTCKYVI